MSEHLGQIDRVLADKLVFGNGSSHVEPINESKLINDFWEANSLAFFPQNIVALVRRISVATLENERWRGGGIPYRKVSGRVLYRKSDVINWLESYPVVSSTSNERV